MSTERNCLSLDGTSLRVSLLLEETYNSEEKLTRV